MIELHSPPADVVRHSSASSCWSFCSAASRSFRRPSRRSSSASASRCGSSTDMRPAGRSGPPGAGISWRIPFAEQIVWIDKRVQDVDMQRQQVLSTDQRRLEVDAFARYRIVDPLLMYIRAGSEEQLREQLRPILGSEVRNELGRIEFAALLTPERQGIMDGVRNSLNRIARQYGVEDARRAHQAHRPARRRAAGLRLRPHAHGARTGGPVDPRAGAEAGADHSAPRPMRKRRKPMPRASARIREFYDFYRAMQSYQIDLHRRRPGQARAPTTIILSPQNDYLKEFTGRPR